HLGEGLVEVTLAELAHQSTLSSCCRILVLK
ncbi:hypothetical protein D018_3453B, partial [Vibrio parahaemolyticus VP2007-007]